MIGRHFEDERRLVDLALEAKEAVTVQRIAAWIRAQRWLSNEDATKLSSRIERGDWKL